MKTSNKLIAAPIAIILLVMSILIIWGRVAIVAAPATENVPVEAPAPPAPPAVPDAPVLPE